MLYYTDDAGRGELARSDERTSERLDRDTGEWIPSDSVRPCDEQAGSPDQRHRSRGDRGPVRSGALGLSGNLETEEGPMLYYTDDAGRGVLARWDVRTSERVDRATGEWISSELGQTCAMGAIEFTQISGDAAATAIAAPEGAPVCRGHRAGQLTLRAHA